MREIAKLVLVMTLIAGGAGLLLSLVEELTREPIAIQRRQESLKALKAVLPETDNRLDEDTVSLVIGQDRKGENIRRVFYRGRRQGELVGVAYKVVAPDGYSGNIEVMVGIDPQGTLSGLEILAHAETPGLGGKIVTTGFRRQFLGKNLTNADWRVKKDGGSFDQITGATISPRAIVKAVAGSLRFYTEHQAEIVAAESGGT